MPFRKLLPLTIVAALCLGGSASAVEIEYPQIIRMRYEAVDPKAGGNFTIWLDRETIRQGLDPRLYPAASYVEVTYVTPAAGSPLLTVIEVQKVNMPTPEIYHIGGSVRFRVNGMVLKSSNMPR
jgi:hypothetical protein